MTYSAFTGSEYDGDIEACAWEALGGVLRHLLTPEPRPGPPYTHTIAPPKVVYTRSGKVLYWEPAGSSYTLRTGGGP